jgi:phospholipid N-methyltransferase
MEVNKALSGAGGKWDRGLTAHVFARDPRQDLGIAATGGGIRDVKTETQFFETPPIVAAGLIAAADIEEGMTVLEPSAGKGALVPFIRAALGNGGSITCIEKESEYANELDARHYDVARLICDDFLQIQVGGAYMAADGYDRIVMNPPFTGGQDCIHVLHAFEFLKRGGRLASIMAPGWTFHSNGVGARFRDWVRNLPHAWYPLPPKSFHDAGTDIETGILVIDASADSKDGAE